jgi:hypothetical protein
VYASYRDIIFSTSYNTGDWILLFLLVYCVDLYQENILEVGEEPYISCQLLGK